MYQQRSYRIVIILILLPLLLVTACGRQAAVQTETELVFCPPLLGTDGIGLMRAPAEAMAAHLAGETGISIGSFVPSDYGATIQGLREGWCDVAYLPAGLYPRVSDELGVVASFMVQVNGSAVEVGAVYVLTDSGINDLAGLRGKRVASSELASASAWVVPAAEIARAGVHPTFDLYVDLRATQADAVVDLLGEKVDAAIAPTWVLQEDAVTAAGDVSRLRTIAQIDGIPIGVIVYGPTVTDAEARALSQALANVVASGASGTDKDGNTVPLLHLFGWDGLQDVDTGAIEVVVAAARDLGMIESE